MIFPFKNIHDMSWDRFWVLGELASQTAACYTVQTPFGSGLLECKSAVFLFLSKDQKQKRVFISEFLLLATSRRVPAEDVNP